MARQTLERHAGACYAGSRPYLGSGLLARIIHGGVDFLEVSGD